MKYLGGPVAAARTLELNSYQTLQQWLEHGVPVKHRVTLELRTGGKWTVEQFGDDAHWVRVKDRAWPHPKGRPLHDIAHEAA